MRTIVTGGAGFIGSHLVHHLLLMGHHVTVIDNLSSGTYENIRRYEGLIDFYELDLSDNVEHTALQYTLLRHMDTQVYWVLSQMLGRYLVHRSK